MIKKIKKIWLNKWRILIALYTLYFSKNKNVRQTIATRRTICQSNKCGHYDKSGTHENIIWKGKPGCDICGCVTLLKVADLKTVCTLKEIGEEPLWAEFNAAEATFSD